MAHILLEKARAAVVTFLAATAFAHTAAHAQQPLFPQRAVTFVIGFTPGGTTDIIGRLVGEDLRKFWGQSIVIENRPGAGGNLAGTLVAKAKPDGYTLMIGSVGPLAVNASLYAKMPYDNLRDFAPITLIANVPNMLVVNPKAMPVASFAEFMALVRSQPEKFFYGSTGSGTSSHLSGELLASLSGIRITHVPYKGAVALNDLLSGEQVHFMFATIPSAIQHVKSGRLRVLAVSSLTRSPGLPDVPTVAELAYPGFDAGSWFGLVGPAGLPAEIAQKIQRDVALALKNPEIRQKMIELGADPVGNTPEEFAAFMRVETAKWARVVKVSGAKAE